MRFSVKHNPQTKRVARVLERSLAAALVASAEKIPLEMRCDPSTSPAELTSKQIVAMHDLLHQLRFHNPDGAHLSPAGVLACTSHVTGMSGSYQTCNPRENSTTCAAVCSWLSGHLPCLRRLYTSALPAPAPPPPLAATGEYNLRLGIMKELRPEMVATHQGAVGVHEGHAFIVEAAISVGGRNIKPGLNIHRFSNRIPLLFEVGH